MTPTKPLLVLDLDETLVHVPDDDIDFDPSLQTFSFGPHHGAVRPHLKAFIDVVAPLFHVGVFSSAGDAYVQHIAHTIVAPLVQDASGEDLQFVWSARQCTQRRDVICDQYFWVKKLARVKKLGFRLEHTLAVDDTPKKAVDNYGNLVRARPFEGAPDDDELLLLARYLPTLAMAENVRRIEKRGWWQTLDRDVDSGEFD